MPNQNPALGNHSGRRKEWLMSFWQPQPWNITQALPVPSFQSVSQSAIRALRGLAPGRFSPGFCLLHTSLPLGLGEHRGELRRGSRACVEVPERGRGVYLQDQRMALSSIREGCPLRPGCCSLAGRRGGGRRGRTGTVREDGDTRRRTSQIS